MVQGIEPKIWCHREKIANVSQQSNDNDCGIFTLMYALSFADWQRRGRMGNPQLDFTEIEISQLKKRLSDGIILCH